MSELDKIIEEAWRNHDNPEVMLAKFKEVFNDYKNNAVFLFEYANALDFLGKEDEAVPLYRRALAMGLSGKLTSSPPLGRGFPEV